MNDKYDQLTGEPLDSSKALLDKRRNRYADKMYQVRTDIHQLLVTAPWEDGSYDDHLRRLVCHIKLDVITNRNDSLIDNDTMQKITSMLYSPDKENITVAEEIIESIYQPLMNKRDRGVDPSFR